MIIGPDLPTLKEMAKTRIMYEFTRRAELDGVPATLRAMYVRKAEQAQLVAAGGSSPLIAAEAELRGISTAQMAQLILGMAASGGDDFEIARIRANLVVDAAQTEGQVTAELAKHGISLEHPLAQMPA